MRRFICCMLLALAILPLTALGEEMPREVKTLYQADAGGVETASDVLNLRDAAGSAWCLIAEDGEDDAEAVTGEGENVPGLHVAVVEAPGVKCPRCWMHSEQADPETGLCPRCAAVVAAMEG